MNTFRNYVNEKKKNILTLLSQFSSSVSISQPSRPALPLASTPSSGPSSTVALPNQETALMTQEDLMLAMATNVASLTSRTSMSALVVGGVVCRFPIRPC